MCGIFGFAAKGSSDIYKKDIKRLLRNLFLLSESRGREASGFAALHNDEITVHKTPLPASKLIKSPVFKDFFSKYPERSYDRFAAIGHSRLVTSGYEQDNENNQPIYKNGFCGVHNGIIVNQKELWEKYKDEKKNTALDTEIIPTLLARFVAKGSSFVGAVKTLYEHIYGTASIAFLSEIFDSLLLATNNGSLYYFFSKDRDAVIFASEKYILQRTVEKTGISTKFNVSGIKQLCPGTAILIDLGSMVGSIFDFDKGTIDGEAIKKRERKIVEIREKHDVSYRNKSLEHGFFIYPKEFDQIYLERKNQIAGLKRCTKCVLPETMPFIHFDSKGVCSYCNSYTKIELFGEDALRKYVDKNRGGNTGPDCIVAFSGGRDSSYGLHYLKKELGLNPLAYTYDWGMVTDLARRNQARICGKLGIEHILVSADIRKKRLNIRKNVLAWLRKPSLGMVPLFMAGDKHFFYYVNKLKQQTGIKLDIWMYNLLERTDFKYGFAGVYVKKKKGKWYILDLTNQIKIASYYIGQFISNPAYINSSVFDTISAFVSYYRIPHSYVSLYNYIRWDEKDIESTLINEYDWETDPGTRTTWRIGDGTAAFYNYIYYMIAGFSENDTLRSNQIREGHMTREDALKHLAEENSPRWDSIKWYCDTIGIDFENTIKRINSADSLYRDRV